ncbi:nuclear mitotic apparatus protein 1 isoform X2 [Heterocephalus glaber]|uniref:Nuclear mitotic apparatus protein 1 isoform X2 n=1 Tax=Heterocephalus glaber TaxID=10181 RepID=A0AAX6RSG4_HETGA|nr:nuclear mitotic apparatus protein 1 isoform X2 [Heterocephalus glaber]
MALHATRAAALLSWKSPQNHVNQETQIFVFTLRTPVKLPGPSKVNSLRVADLVEAVPQLQDCSVFIKIIDGIRGTEEGQQILQQPVPERLDFVCSFLQKNRKRPSSPECLVSMQKVMEGSELELAKIIMLLLYHSSMSSQNLRDWEQFEYRIQAELAVILKFMLDHEDGLNLTEDLEIFLQKVPVSPTCSSTFSEDLSPPSHQAKREVHFLELQKVASSSSGNNFLSGSPASPMGDILQTPQFQMRRLKKQLADERNNRDELELELAEHRKLLTEKDAQISMMQQRIDRLALLNEKQAASPLEPRELEELRGKNESLTFRLHETLKQCQDLKTEKGQMDRKINQLSEENGDLSFKLREFASNLQQLQGALNELTEEHSKATQQWVEKQAHLEKELSTALQDKKCLEEKNEILQGKLSQLEERLAQLPESPRQEKGEVLGDVLQLESLKQEAATLATNNTQLQARVEMLENEQGQKEAQLLGERSHFEEEKQQLASLITNLQSSISNLSQAKEELEQASQAQGAKLNAQVASLTAELTTLSATLQQQDQELAGLKQQAQKKQAQLAQSLQQQEQASQGLRHQVEQLSGSLKQKEKQLEEAARELDASRRDHAQQLATAAKAQETSLRERDAACQQLEALEKEKAAKLEILQQQLQAANEAQDSAQNSVTQAQREKAELSQKVEELHALIEAAHQEQCEAQTQVAALEARLKAEQQKATEREKVAQEKAQLQEQLWSLEESLKITKGSLEEEKCRAAAALEEHQHHISEMEAESRSLAEQHKQERKELEEEKAKRRGLGVQLQQLAETHQAETKALRQELAKARTSNNMAEREVELLVKEVKTWRKRYEDSQQGETQYGLQEQLTTLKEEYEKSCQELRETKEKMAGIEAHSELQIGQHQSELAQLHANLARALQQVQEKENRAQKLADDLSTLQEKMAATSKEVARLEALVRKAGEQQETASLELLKEPPKTRDRESEWVEEQQGQQLCSTQAALRAMEREAEQMGTELEKLRAALMESQGQQQEERGQQEREVARLTQERGQAEADLALEKAAKAELEMRLQNALNEQQAEFANLQEALSRALSEKEGKDQELSKLCEQEAVQRMELKELLQTVEQLKAQLAKKEKEQQQSARGASGENASGMGTQSEAVGKMEALRAKVSKLEQQCQQQQEEADSLARSLESERAFHVERDRALETLQGQLEEKARELGYSQAASASAQRELATLRAKAQDHSKAEEEWKAQVARGQQEAVRKGSLISSLEEEVSILNRQVLEKEGESKELKRLVIAESEKSQKLEERLRLLQMETASNSARAAERSSALREEVQSLREEVEKQRAASENLRQELASQAERAEELGQELKAWQEKFFQKEQALSALQLEHTSTQALVSELLPAKHLCQQLQAEQVAAEKRHREELEQSKQAAGGLRTELMRAQRELGELVPLRQKVAEQERAAQQLRAEKASYAEQLSMLKKAHGLLAEENRGLGERANLGRQFLEVELDQAREKYIQELAAVRGDAETRLAEMRQEVQSTTHELEVMTAKYEGAKVKVLEERQRFQEERQKLTAQVEELSKKLADYDQASKVQQQKLKAFQAQGGESQQEAQRLQTQLNELQVQLSQKEQAAEHYKVQMEKAKTHYDAKKQQNQELQEQLQGLEQLQKENKELRAEAERLGQELQQAGLKTKEAEQTCRHLTAQVRSLEAQVAHADQQLRELGKFQVASDALKSREPQAKPQLDLSIDSLDLSCEEGTPLSITSKLPRTQPDGTSVPGEPASPISQRLPPKVESLESLYFTPIPARGPAPLESSLDSLGEPFLDSGRKTRSARRRTTQIINITMTKKLDVEEPDSANSSFYSTRSAPASQAGLRATSSTQSLARLGSPDDGNSALLSLPGYRPTTRSSTRRSQAGVSSGAPPGRNSFYMGTCQDEPEQLDDWNRIAELQQRNRVCPPHLKTCYPLESRPSLGLATITDEEMKTGDPQETLRRASMQPGQIAEGAGITTRQQRKRVSSETHQGPGTPESKKATSCFPRPITPRDRHEGRKQSTTETQKKAVSAAKQADRRQSMAFSILNTPKKLGSSLLRRGVSKKAPAKASPNTRSGTRRSPRIATSTASAATTTPRARGKAKH